MTRVAGVLLAAGGSRRLGRPKQLLEWRGEALVCRAARAALEAGVDELVVVTGAQREAVAAALEGLDVRLIGNARWQDGIGSSIAAGAGAVPHSDAVLLLLTDQPGVDAGLLSQLMGAMREGHRRVACRYGGVLGVPALFSDPADLEELRSLSGDRGASSLLRHNPSLVHGIPAEQAACDIDVESDWTRWQRDHESVRT